MPIKSPFQYLFQHIKYPWNITKLQQQGDQKLYDALNKIVALLDQNTPTTVRYIRTLLIKNTTVGVDIADAVVAQNDGTPYQVAAVLKDIIDSDLTVNININGKLLIALNIPFTTVPLSPPIIFTNFSVTTINQNDILTADIIDSDGSINADGIASFTLEWM
jgi:hypothetical protein